MLNRKITVDRTQYAGSGIIGVSIELTSSDSIKRNAVIVDSESDVDTAIALLNRWVDDGCRQDVSSSYYIPK